MILLQQTTYPFMYLEPSMIVRSQHYSVSCARVDVDVARMSTTASNPVERASISHTCSSLNPGSMYSHLDHGELLPLSGTGYAYATNSVTDSDG